MHIRGFQRLMPYSFKLFLFSAVNSRIIAEGIDTKLPIAPIVKSHPVTPSPMTKSSIAIQPKINDAKLM